MFLGENWWGTLILSQFSNFRQDFVDFTVFSKYLTNSGGKPKKNCQNCLKMDSRKLSSPSPKSKVQSPKTQNQAQSSPKSKSKSNWDWGWHYNHMGHHHPPPNFERVWEGVKSSDVCPKYLLGFRRWSMSQDKVYDWMDSVIKDLS